MATRDRYPARAMTGTAVGGNSRPSYPRPEGVHPPLAYPSYTSTALRAPRRPLVVLPQNLTEVSGPVFGAERVGECDNDLTRQHAGEPVGQRIVVHGRVLDGSGAAVPDTLLEVWQANAGGRYRHPVDQWPTPLDPNCSGAGRTFSDADGRYSFTTVKPGAYPWKKHHNAWRPAHITSRCSGWRSCSDWSARCTFPRTRSSPTTRS